MVMDTCIYLSLEFDAHPIIRLVAHFGGCSFYFAPAMLAPNQNELRGLSCQTIFLLLHIQHGGFLGAV